LTEMMFMLLPVVIGVLPFFAKGFRFDSVLVPFRHSLAMCPGFWHLKQVMVFFFSSMAWMLRLSSGLQYVFFLKSEHLVYLWLKNMSS
jgi:hypothetical protein